VTAQSSPHHYYPPGLTTPLRPVQQFDETGYRTVLNRLKPSCWAVTQVGPKPAQKPDITGDVAGVRVEPDKPAESVKGP
jgi:hypothetical protein